LAAGIRALEDGLDWGVCRPSWSYKQRKWVTACIDIEDSEESTDSGEVTDLVRLLSILQACIKPAHQAGGFSGASLKALRARLQAANDTGTVRDAIEALTAAMQLQPEPPAWLAAAASPPAPAATVVSKVASAHPGTSLKSPIEPNHLSFVSPAALGLAPDPIESGNAPASNDPAEDWEQDEVIEVDDEGVEAVDSRTSSFERGRPEMSLGERGNHADCSSTEGVGLCSKEDVGLLIEVDSTDDSLAGTDDDVDAADAGGDGPTLGVAPEDLDRYAGHVNLTRGSDAPEGAPAASAAAMSPSGILSTILPRGLTGLIRWWARAP
jgi:hypothetical protein